MANTAVLERTPVQMNVSLKDRLISPAEEAHKRQIADNFRRLRFESVEDYNSAREGDPVADIAVAEPEEEVSPAAARIAQYTPAPAPAGRHELFEGVVYKDGKLEMPQTETPKTESVVTAAPALTPDEEDATPTRRTMDTLNRPAAMQTEEAVAALAPTAAAALSTKLKVALIAVVATIILAIVLICVNSSIIRSINSDIAARQAQLSDLTQATQTVREQIADLTSPESIAEWAAKNNMVLE